jgi:hypothetical protein
MTAQQLTDTMITDVRRQLDTAAIEGALARGEIVRTPAEQIDCLMVEMRRLVRAGEMDAARALRSQVMALLDELDTE